MTRNSTLLFSKRYHAALRRHLNGRLRGRLPPRSAGSLGQAAVSSGLDTLDLARVHNRALAALEAARPIANGRNNDGTLTQAAQFFLGVLAPIERLHQTAQKAASHAQRLDGVLRERTTALAGTRRRMRREIAKRKTCERLLVRKARHYRTLLAQSRRLARQILSAQEEERKEISRELHDEVAQILAGINVQLAALKEAAAINGRSLRRRIAQTQRLVEQSVEIVHRYARELRPALLDDLGLIPALRSYIRNLPGRGRLRIRFVAFPGVEALNNARRTVLYRVAQEALTNVARHAHARRATIFIQQIPGAVQLEVHDDGRSFPVDRLLASSTNKRLGLIGMRERVEMVGGNFAIESAPGMGTTVRAEVPCRGDHSGSAS